MGLCVCRFIGKITWTNRKKLPKVVATGIISSFSFIFGAGIIIEGGTIFYDEEEWGIYTVNFGGGFDFGVSSKFIWILADPETFNIYDLQGNSTQGGGNIMFLSVAVELPWKEGYEDYEYVMIPGGLSLGLRYGVSLTNGRTWIVPPGKDATMKELYEGSPGGY